MNWDIHHNGHCYYASGLDAYIEYVDGPHPIGWKVVGPFARSGELERKHVEEAVRSLTVQLEATDPSKSKFPVWGVIASNDPHSRLPTINVLGTELGFQPNFSLRSSVWDGFPFEIRSQIYAREWETDPTTNCVRHKIGISFRFERLRAPVLGMVQLAHGLLDPLVWSADRQSLEDLGDRGFALLTGFDHNRLFVPVRYCW